MRVYRCLILCLGLLASVGAPAYPEPSASSALTQRLIALAPEANPVALQLAAQATSCAVQNGEAAPQRLAVIDYSRPSTSPRLWLFDLTHEQMLYQELVAHGRNSGDNYAQRFSNTPESHESSLGLFRTLNTYQGQNGYSLRLQGLERGFNDLALERQIVVHGADYVDPKFARSNGRLGRSWGCPAVRREVARPLIDQLKGGQLLFAYYPEKRWLAQSRYLNCSGSGNSLAKAAAH